MTESSRISRALVSIFTPDKLNLAAIGNLVRQLHVHHIARFRTDPAWPATVWGRAPGEPYAEAELDELKQAFANELPELGDA